MKFVVFFVSLLVTTSCVYGRAGFGPTDQEWGYVNIRDGANLFWWLHYTTAEISDPASKPLIIWLQGGPGGSSTGLGNFGEIGPWDEFLQRRDYAWTNNYNVLFLDNPVGTGFSYVDSIANLAKNNREVAEDFLVFLKGFYKQFPAFSNTPLYIFSQSYGGKMAAEIALVVDQAQKAGEIPSNLKGIALGDPWISPADLVMTWGPYLFNQGLLDTFGYAAIQEIAVRTAEAVNNGQYADALSLFDELQPAIDKYSSKVSFYNILNKVKAPANLKNPSLTTDTNELNNVMNNQVKQALGLTQEWTAQNFDVFDALQNDFMKPAIDIVEQVLNQTNIDVVVYNGQLDLIVDTPGTTKWVYNLNWDGAERWRKSDHNPMVVNGIIEGFYKNIDKLTFYWVSRAGHVVPSDNPSAMDFILKKTIRE